MKFPFRLIFFVISARVKDFAFSKLLPLIAFLYVFRYWVSPKKDNKSFGYLLKSRRTYPLPMLDKSIIEKQHKYCAPLDVNAHVEPPIARFIVLKLPHLSEDGAVEKGLLLIKFTETFDDFQRSIDVSELCNYFYFVLEPSWAGYAIEQILRWQDPRFGSVIVFCPEKDDYKFIAKLHSNLVPTSLGAGDWVDDRVFHPIQVERKTYDSVYVANYNAIKRVHRFLRAISKIDISGYRAALVCASWGKSRYQIRGLADYYGLDRKVEIFEDLGAGELNEVLGYSKVNMLLSYKEGANKSIFEGFFANVPAMVLENNIGVNKEHINEMTGKLIKDCDLEDWLIWFYSNWQKFEPASWARANISPVVSTNKLNEVCRRVALKKGNKWDFDAHVKINAPELDYYQMNGYGYKGKINSDLVQIFGIGSSKEKHLEKMISFRDKWKDILVDLPCGKER